ncbi:hypothetical protein NKG05_27875 [Oerskovia sp. M15]
MRALTSVELASEGRAGARLPSAAWRAVRDALGAGPVLVQVPRAGYMPVVACARCRTAAHCGTCHGPLMLPGPGASPSAPGAVPWRRLVLRRVPLDGTALGTGRVRSHGRGAGPRVPGVAVRVSGASAPGG